MQLNLLYKISLNESAFEQNKATEFASIFKKLDVYAHNQRYVYEGYNVSTVIPFTLNEQQQIQQMFTFIEYKLLEQYLDEGVFKNFLNKAKEIGKKGVDYAKDKWNDLKTYITKLPQRIKSVIQFIENLLKSGIKKASELVKAIGQFLSRLGDSISEAIASLKFFNDEKYINGAPKLNARLDSLDKNAASNATFKYVLQYVLEKAKNKECIQAVNEAEEMDYVDSTGKIDRWFLDKKDDWLDKSKNNTLFRLFISGTNANGERLGLFKVLLISIIGSFLFCTLVPLIASSAFGLAGTGLTILIVACRALWVLKNVCRIIINRTLTYKQHFHYKNGVVKHSHLFDLRTILALIIAVLTPALFMIYHQEITDWFHSLFNCNKEIPTEIVEKNDPVEIEEDIDKVVVNDTPTEVVNNASKGVVLSNVEPTNVEPITVEDRMPELVDPVSVVELPDKPNVDLDGKLELVVKEINKDVDIPIETVDVNEEEAKDVIEVVRERTCDSVTRVAIVQVPPEYRGELYGWATENGHRVIVNRGGCYAINLHSSHVNMVPEHPVEDYGYHHSGNGYGGHYHTYPHGNDHAHIVGNDHYSGNHRGGSGMRPHTDDVYGIPLGKKK